MDIPLKRQLGYSYLSRDESKRCHVKRRIGKCHYAGVPLGALVRVVSDVIW